jgi:NDP-sugar pyrophosphorylase family protein
MPSALTGLDAIVLAGGLGTRLRSILPNQQKVTAIVGGEPFLSHLIRWLADAGIARVVLAAGHRAQDVEALAATLAGSGAPVVVSAEPAPLGTGGATRLALPQTESNPVLVLNGDSFTAIDLTAFRTFHEARSAEVSLVLVPVPDRSRYGALEIDSRGAVLSFREKADSDAAAGNISAGIYLFNRPAVAAIPANRPVSLERDVFPGLIGKGLYAMVFNAGFIDIGTPESLLEAEHFFGAGDLSRDH